MEIRRVACESAALYRQRFYYGTVEETTKTNEARTPGARGAGIL